MLLSCVKATSEIYTDRIWWRCELVPSRCADEGVKVRYPDFASVDAIRIGPQEASHYSGGDTHHALVPMNRRYIVEVNALRMGRVHMEAAQLTIGEQMRAGDWVEIATNAYSRWP